MNLAALSLENAPGFWVPLRFFLAVPVFGVIAAVVLFIDGGQLLQSRWQAATLAVTHAFTLGYIAMAMLGALFQMLPVVMGASFPRAERASLLVYLLFTAGTLCLVFAFLMHKAVLFAAAIVILVPVLVLFGLGVLVVIGRTGNVGATARGVQLAAVGLIVTAALGGYLGSGYAFEGLAPGRSATDYHAAWGLVGWIFVLIIAISGQVIPMFLATPPYPRRFNRGMAYLSILFLCIGSLVPSQGVREVCVAAVIVLMTVYAVVTLKLLQKRRRKRFDITNWFWRFGQGCLVAGGAVIAYGYSARTFAGQDGAMLAGLLLLAGFAVSLINGMLYKIVPFLVWLNLRMPVLRGEIEAGTRLYTPNIHEVIDVRPMKLQFVFHVAGLLLLVVTVFQAGSWGYAAAAAMLISNLLLLMNLLHATRLYRKYSSQILEVR